MLPNRHRAATLDEPAPRMLNRYRLLGQLAKGGMAEVYLARSDGIGGFQRLLVIKRILPELASDAEFVRMFLDEARIAATLHHANVVQVFDVDMADGQVFYVMEHLHGQDVGTVVRRLTDRAARMPLGNAIAITSAIAAGLHYAHERCASDGQPLGIVHRDVAPNNVIVTYDGNVKLIDFGIAKAVNNLSRTRFGLFKGKLPYASPEQCRCEALDRRSDVFSLGAVLYELTTGERLFTADNEYELIRVVSEAVVPRPRLRDKSYPRELEAIVLRALAAAPDDRYESAQALQHALEVFAVQQQVDLSAMSLSRLMETLFNPELLRWRSAERAGLTLEQHIITTTTSGRAPSLAADIATEDTSILAPAAARRGSASQGAPAGVVSARVMPASGAPGEAAAPAGALDAMPGAMPGATADAMLDVIAGAMPDVTAGAVPGAMAGAMPGEMPEGMVDAVDEPRSSDPPRIARREGARIARYVVFAAVAGALVGLGALGALWWTQPMDTAPASVPAATSRATTDPVPAVAPPAAAPAAPEPAPASPPSAAPAGVDPASPPARAVVDPPSSPAAPPAADPALARASDDAVAPDRAPHPSRRPKHPRPRPARAQPAAEPAAPDERGHSRLDDATLDEVAPRSQRSP